MTVKEEEEKKKESRKFFLKLNVLFLGRKSEVFWKEVKLVRVTAFDWGLR